MADYYTNFSFLMKLPSKEIRDVALDLAKQAKDYDKDVVPHTLPEALVAATEDWWFQTHACDWEENSLWFQSENDGIEALCSFIQYLLQSYDPQGFIGFEWSNYCSRPRIDAFGGGAAFITAKKIKFMSTCSWLIKQTAKISGQNNNPCPHLETPTNKKI